jgi:hypothetical protein
MCAVMTVYYDTISFQLLFHYAMKLHSNLRLDMALRPGYIVETLLRSC